jgi:hypothetical protein
MFATTKISNVDKVDRGILPRLFPRGQFQPFGVPAAIAGTGRIEFGFSDSALVHAHVLRIAGCIEMFCRAIKPHWQKFRLNNSPMLQIEQGG